MSASISMHGPFSAGSRFVERADTDRQGFVSLDISTDGVSAILIDVKAADLDSLTEAIAAARKVLPA